jgi:hypothetical protein
MAWRRRYRGTDFNFGANVKPRSVKKGRVKKARSRSGKGGALGS